MIERMARAMCASDGENPEAFHTRADYEAQDRDGVMLTDAAFPLWMGYRKRARAAIEALREPTDAMVEAGVRENTCDLPSGGSLTMAVEPAWEAMIDAALTS